MLAIWSVCRSPKGDSFTLGLMPGENQPSANKLFPELLAACYELEAAMLPMRPPSSTVVVNRHAQFMPHTDSGAGHGQSKSLIVALGAFTGGELVVEGDVSNIRYRPLEFDGWKQRHWTLPFVGERFSLVWFTPHGCVPGAPTRHCTLRTGAAMPLLGLGTFRQKADAVTGPLRAALRAGYRHVDTAAVYRNQTQVGATIAAERDVAAGCLRGDPVFVTSKLAPAAQGYAEAAAGLEATIAALGLGRPLDLYLIHWPGTAGKRLDDPANARRRAESWRALEDALEAGKVRAIGVSNFQPEHLAQLLSDCRVVPHVNQVELHPRLQQRALVALCRANGIQVVAYASLGVGGLLADPVPVRIAARCGRTAPQVLLRWAVQKGYCVIPKATQPVHVAANAQIWDFSLSAADMDALDAMEDAHRFCWDPTEIA